MIALIDIEDSNVSVEEAKALKALGFELKECETWMPLSENSSAIFHNELTCVKIPTVDMAIDWLLANYRVYVGVIRVVDEFYYVIDMTSEQKYPTPFQAKLAGLKEILSSLFPQ